MPQEVAAGICACNLDARLRYRVVALHDGTEVGTGGMVPIGPRTAVVPKHLFAKGENTLLHRLGTIRVTADADYHHAVPDDVNDALVVSLPEQTTATFDVPRFGPPVDKGDVLYWCAVPEHVQRQGSPALLYGDLTEPVQLRVLEASDRLVLARAVGTTRQDFSGSSGSEVVNERGEVIGFAVSVATLRSDGATVVCVYPLWDLARRTE